ncbi:MAG: glycosyltransferase family 4 protein [Dehalococcoidia bacterium]
MPSAPKPLHVCMVTSSYPRWPGDAAGSFVADLAHALVAEGVRVTVVAPDAPGVLLRDKWAGVEVRRARYWLPASAQRLAYGAGIASNLRATRLATAQVPPMLASLAAVAARVPDVDIFHGHFLQTGAAAWLAAKVRRRPLVVTAHGSDVHGDVGGDVGSRLGNWVARRASRTIAVSEPLAETIRTGTGQPVDVIHIGVDIQRFRPAPEERVPGRILCVGRLVDLKGHRFAIEAMPAILDRVPSARLMIAGAGVIEDELRGLAGRAGVASQVEFLGEVSREAIPALLRTAAVYLQPSLSEGFAVSLLEAMASGLPVVASELPAFGDRLTDGQTGRIVPVGGVAAIADRVSELLLNPELGGELGSNARALVADRYTWCGVAQRTISVYRASIRGIA